MAPVWAGHVPVLAHAEKVPVATTSDTTSKPLPQVKLGAVRVYGLLSPQAYRIGGTDSATHTDTPLIDIPQTVKAIPIALLHDQGAQSLEDAMRNAPGVSVHQGEGNRDEIVIRGIKTKSAFFIDGVPDDAEYFRDLYNVQEVDVLQGASAVLFGRGGAGGVVNLITKKPADRRFVHMGLQLGSWAHRRLTVDANMPFGQGNGLRINVMGEDSNGFRQYAYLHRYGVNPQVRFDLGQNTMLELGAQHLYDKRRADRGIPSRGNRPVAVARDRFFGSPTQNFARAVVSSAHARWEHYAGDLTLRDTFRAVHTAKFYQNLFPGSAVADDDTLTLSGYRHHNNRTGFFNEAEMEWDTHTGPLSHTLLVGLDVSQEADDDWETVAEDVTDVALAHPVAVGVFDHPKRDNRVIGHNAAMYAEDQIGWGQWKALLGLRYTRFSVDARFHLDGNVGIHHVDTDWSPRAGLIYQPTGSQSIYASVTRTFTPQGSNIALSMKSPEGADLPPQTSTNVELGYKVAWLGGKLGLSTDVFQMDQENVISKDPNDPTVLVQTGAQRVRGFEASLSGRLTQHWSIDAGFAHLDASIRHATKHAAAGARVPLVPDRQFSLWAKCRIDRHWGVAGGVVGNSHEYTGFDNTVVLPGYVRADAMAYWQADGYRLSLNLDNLFDTHYYPTANGNNQIMPGTPRNAELRLRVTL